MLGFKSADRVLVIGNPGFMPWLTSSCADITSVKRTTELKALVLEGKKFDRIVVARESQFEHEMAAYAGPLLAVGENEGGALVVFHKEDGWQAREAVRFYYPEARSWEFDTTYGRALMAEVRGVSWRYYDA